MHARLWHAGLMAMSRSLGHGQQGVVQEVSCALRTGKATVRPCGWCSREHREKQANLGPSVARPDQMAWGSDFGPIIRPRNGLQFKLALSPNLGS